MQKDIKIIVEQANAGDQKSLEKVILHIKDMIYNLALKMLLFPEDAKDATQEILVKVITHLSTFEGGSKFQTWVYRIAVNYLLNLNKKNAQRRFISFEDYAKQIDTGQSDSISYATNEGELSLLEEEVKVSCTHGLLMCLNEQSRMIYILGDILAFNSLEGGSILDISSDNFRKQLSRSRKKIRNFLNNKCGLANPNNPCRCKRKIDFLVGQGMMDPKNLRFANETQRSIDLVEKIDDLGKALAIYQSVPNIPTPEEVVLKMKEMINNF